MAEDLPEFVQTALIIMLELKQIQGLCLDAYIVFQEAVRKENDPNARKNLEFIMQPEAPLYQKLNNVREEGDRLLTECGDPSKLNDAWAEGCAVRYQHIHEGYRDWGGEIAKAVCSYSTNFSYQQCAGRLLQRIYQPSHPDVMSDVSVPEVVVHRLH